MVKLRLRLFKQSHQEKQIMCSRRVSGTWKIWIYISIIYILDGKYWNPNEVNVDEIFAYSATLNMIVENEDREPKCMQRKKWLAEKFSIEAKLNSQEKWKVLRHKVFIWRCQANETHVYLIISLMRHLILKGSIQQTYNILIIRKYILMWWLQLLFIIRLVWQFMKGKSLPLMDILATYMYGLHN